MNSLIHHNLRNVAAADPEHEAYRCAGKSLSYGELDHKSSQLASLLIHHGVKPGDRVAIRLPLCLESAIAVYGILKAGAAFVPIDPLAPAKRLCDLLNIGGIHWLVTDRLKENFIDSLERDAPVIKVIVGSSAREETAIQMVPWSVLDTYEEVEPIDIDGHSPAYVIFTSGSTGSPKGIIHTHFSGNSYARLSAGTYGVTAKDRIANISPLHFDMATFGFLTSVRAGATTVLIPTAYSKLPASLSLMMEEERITIWYSVPFSLIQLLERGLIEQRELSCLRWVKFGGEPFSPMHLCKMQAIWPEARFCNVYGPAEVNQCSYYHVPRLKDSDDQPIPLGSIWGETRSLIVDERDQPVAKNEVGELLIHSNTMMARYWDGMAGDEKTFYIRADGRRYYRTGDLVSHNERGELVFLGRKDRQVKVRGYRIELDEIEHVATAYDAVEEAAAFCLSKDNINEVALAVTPVDQVSLDETELRTHLASRLPGYAVPGQIFIRAEMPRTTSGKINRKALQAVDEAVITS